MNDILYATRFIRADGKPMEEYPFRTEREATDYMLSFRDDDSGLYTRIEVIRWDFRSETEECIARIRLG